MRTDPYSPENPPPLRRPGESVADYRVRCGWDKPKLTEVMSTAPALSKRWKDDGHRTIVTDDDGHLLICEVFSGGVGISEADKVQRAIAALPEVLETLQFAVRFYDQLTPSDAERMRKVLEKAGAA